MQLVHAFAQPVQQRVFGAHRRSYLGVQLAQGVLLLRKQLAHLVAYFRPALEQGVRSALSSR